MTTVASVVGFPHGTHTTAVKAYEARVAIDDGARELDMVIALPALLGGEYRAVHDDIAAVVNEARSCKCSGQSHPRNLLPEEK